jgi:hypothetical protein
VPHDENRSITRRSASDDISIARSINIPKRWHTRSVFGACLVCLCQSRRKLAVMTDSGEDLAEPVTGGGIELADLEDKEVTDLSDR